MARIPRVDQQVIAALQAGKIIRIYPFDFYWKDGKGYMVDETGLCQGTGHERMVDFINYLEIFDESNDECAILG